MRDRLIDALLLGAALAIFLCATFYQIRLPALYYDEAYDVVPAMQIVQGDTKPLEVAYAVKGRIPAMVTPYIGAVSTYAVLPFFWLFGVGVESTRAMTILMAALGLAFAYFFIKELFDRRVAALTILLAAVHPALAFWSRMGIYVASPVLPRATASLFCLLRWRQRRRTVYLYTAAFLFGLGLSTKILFLWFIIAVLLAGLLLGRLPRLRLGRWTIGQDRAAPEISLRTAVVAAALFLAGAWMIVVYNLRTQDTIRIVLHNLIKTDAGVNNLAVLSNMKTELRALVIMLDSSYFQRLWGTALVNHLMPIVFFVSLVVLIVLLLRRGLPWAWRRVAFIMLLVTAIWLQSAFTITGLGPLHLYVLYPFLQLLIVLAALGLAQRCRVLPLGVALLLALFVTDAWTLMDHHRTLSQSGGMRAFSDANYTLAADLETRRGDIVAVDWGFERTLAILTQGRVQPAEVFGGPTQTPRPDFAEKIKPYLARSDTWLIFHSPQHTSFAGRFDAVTRLAAEMKRKLVLERTFYQRDGTETIYIYRTEPVSP
jgi:4-amino-4-deoxy-L-arabinose transferase-like glycosyltransferase